MSLTGRLLCRFTAMELPRGYFRRGDIATIDLMAYLAVACHFPDRTQRVDECIEYGRLVHLWHMNRFYFAGIV